MAYSTFQDIETRFGSDVIRRLATPSGESQPGVTDTDIVQDFISRADRRIDLYIGKLYTVPFAAASVPAFIRDLSEVLTKLLLMRDRHGALKGTAKDQYQEVVEILEAIGDGSRAIPGLALSGALKPTSNTDDGRAHIFTRSHYDENGNKIEADDFAGSLDDLL